MGTVSAMLGVVGDGNLPDARHVSRWLLEQDWPNFGAWGPPYGPEGTKFGRAASRYYFFPPRAFRRLSPSGMDQRSGRVGTIIRIRLVSPMRELER
jgi:hypothetical protein